MQYYNEETYETKCTQIANSSLGYS